MADTSVALVKQRVAQTAPLTDTKNDVEPPLDFSFFSLTIPEDAERQEPRAPCLGKPVTPRGEGEKSASRSLRLNNNHMTELKGLFAITEKLYLKPSLIGWIDLSFNDLPNIDPVLLQFENLQILYLHANKITEMKEVEKLTGLRHLRKLTLHGNEIENIKGYRLTVISMMPWLTSFDFSAVTKCEARTAASWQRLTNPPKKKKRIQDDD